MEERPKWERRVVGYDFIIIRDGTILKHSERRVLQNRIVFSFFCKNRMQGRKVVKIRKAREIKAFPNKGERIFAFRPFE